MCVCVCVIFFVLFFCSNIENSLYRDSVINKIRQFYIFFFSLLSFTLYNCVKCLYVLYVRRHFKANLTERSIARYFCIYIVYQVYTRTLYTIYTNTRILLSIFSLAILFFAYFFIFYLKMCALASYIVHKYCVCTQWLIHSSRDIR